MQATGDGIVKWGEFVELGSLREYRRKGVPLPRLRPVIDELRRRLGPPYLLATARPYMFDKELVLELQERNDTGRRSRCRPGTFDHGAGTVIVPDGPEGRLKAA